MRLVSDHASELCTTGLVKQVQISLISALIYSIQWRFIHQGSLLQIGYSSLWSDEHSLLGQPIQDCLSDWLELGGVAKYYFNNIQVIMLPSWQVLDCVYTWADCNWPSSLTIAACCSPLTRLASCCSTNTDASADLQRSSKSDRSSPGLSPDVCCSHWYKSNERFANSH